ncbi:DUF4138 domain-containing protein [Allomuricauda sp. F6463D]|uniref:DUF4138 domain-containing protein n=1 Tax=Allomuricauda sp. F6463D TaxID=2926409 RepID=UPI001FF430BD|nr:DUF4138 domain-containing protein [Muricauda sp. F6463D]MCK0160464.1 conjugative transposon protein TraN [Muricauda sp. F6463D]
MKNVCIILGMLLTIAAQASSTKPLDTIYANEHMNMALFFPSEIKQGIVGNGNFVFTYDRENQQTLGLLKAVPGKDSNLLVITDDGSIYSYIISYAKELEYPNRFITEQERIGRERKGMEKDTPNMVPSEKVWDPSVSLERVREKYKESCEALLKLPERKNIRKRDQGLSLAIKNMYNLEDEVYMQFEVSNNSGVRFDFGELELFKISGKKERNASYQELELLPLFRHNVPKNIDHGQTARFVYVFPKFHLDKGERLKVNLSEEDTSRIVVMTFK